MSRTWSGARAGAATITGRVRPLVHAWLRSSRTLATVTGALGYIASWSPSLLPRAWLLQGLVSGVSLAAWYGAGVVIARGWRAFATWAGLELAMTRPGPRRLLRGGWALVLAAVVLIAPLTALASQQRLASSMGARGPTVAGMFLAIGLSVLTFAVLTVLWHGLQWLFGFLLRRMHRWPHALATPLASVLLVLLVVGVLQYVVLGGVLRIVGARSVASNTTTPPGTSAPVSRFVSGGPESGSRWEDFGYEGKSFVSGTTTREDIERVTGRPALDPIRVHAGREVGDSIRHVTQALLAEMDRTNAWERSVIVLVTTTGQGWVNNWGVSAVEYLTGGDCATAAIQHSTLPSALALLDAPTRPRAAGQIVTHAIEERLAALPATARPKFYVTGESLGSYGGHAAFSSASDMLERIDGAVWTGTPGFTEIHAELTGRRVLGSTQINPVVDNGRLVRFASNAAELAADQFGRPLGEWQFPRVVYLQHPSDPIVWWSTGLLVREPDWLDETRTGTPAAEMSWLPLVTFWQVTGDMPGATSVPTGYGHNYHDEVIAAWAAVLDRRDPHLEGRVLEAIRARAQSWE